MFNGLEKVSMLTNNWVREYNEQRSHDALNHLTP
jgi:hypothetical protein